MLINLNSIFQVIELTMWSSCMSAYMWESPTVGNRDWPCGPVACQPIWMCESLTVGKGGENEETEIDLWERKEQKKWQYVPSPLCIFSNFKHASKMIVLLIPERLSSIVGEWTQQTFSGKDQTVCLLGFADYMVCGSLSTFSFAVIRHHELSIL